MCPFLPNPNLPQKIAETDVPRGYIRKINFDVNLPIQTWTPHAYIPTNLSNDLGVVAHNWQKGAHGYDPFLSTKCVFSCLKIFARLRAKILQIRGKTGHFGVKMGITISSSW